MILGLGASASNQNQSSQQNTITNDMSFFFGDDNKGGNDEYGSLTNSATQERKDELGLSASVGVGVGGNGSGGLATLSRGGDVDDRTLTQTQKKMTPNDYQKWAIFGIFGIGLVFTITYLWKTFKKGK